MGMCRMRLARAHLGGNVAAMGRKPRQIDDRGKRRILAQRAQAAVGFIAGVIDRIAARAQRGDQGLGFLGSPMKQPHARHQQYSAKTRAPAGQLKPPGPGSSGRLTMSRPFLRHWYIAQCGRKAGSSTGEILFQQLQLRDRGAGIDRPCGRFHTRAQIRRQAPPRANPPPHSPRRYPAWVPELPAGSPVSSVRYRKNLHL